MRTGFAFTLLAFMGAGCTLDPAPPPEPLPTDGPGQVVIHVPAMTCEGCPTLVAQGLSTVPWIAVETIHADRKARQVKFTVKDRAKFNLDEVKQAVGERYASGVKLLAGPTP